jgi:Co/Zn/Cd efflux system component
VILYWCRGLLMETGAALLDHGGVATIADQVRQVVEAESDNRVVDLHLWRIAPGHDAAIVAIVSPRPQSPTYYKSLIAKVHRFSHLTVEVHPRDDADAVEPTITS